jgi:hypothetical protein
MELLAGSDVEHQGHMFVAVKVAGSHIAATSLKISLCCGRKFLN